MRTVTNLTEPAAAESVATTARAAWGVRLRGLRFQRRRDLGLVIGAGIVATFVMAAILGPLLAPLDPTYQYADGLSPAGAPLPPGSGRFLLGTDELGRDVLSRLIYGAREAMLIAMLPNALSLALATTIGVIAGYFSGRVDTLLMRFTDMMMTLPTFLLALALLAVLGGGLPVVVLALVLVTWTYPARVVYGEVLRIKESAYVEAERALGASAARILLYHIVPQLKGLLIVYFTSSAAFMVVTEAGLGYLGAGIPPPTPSWGAMIGESQDYYLTAPWLVLLPGGCLALVTIGFSLLGDGIERRLSAQRTRVRL